MVMAKRKYIETVNSVKFRDGSFIIIVIDYELGSGEPHNKIYRFLMDRFPTAGRKYIPKNQRWYIDEEYYLTVVEFIRSFNFYVSQEATRRIYQLWEEQKKLVASR